MQHRTRGSNERDIMNSGAGMIYGVMMFAGFLLGWAVSLVANELGVGVPVVAGIGMIVALAALAWAGRSLLGMRR